MAVVKCFDHLLKGEIAAHHSVHTLSLHSIGEPIVYERLEEEVESSQNEGNHENIVDSSLVLEIRFYLLHFLCHFKVV